MKENSFMRSLYDFLFAPYTIAKLLIKKGANLDIKDNKGNTALMIAILLKNYEIIKLLIDRGADLSIRNNQGNTPLIELFRTNIPY